ncbi:MAG: hypothetical protein LBB45_05215 [Methanobrevibacter sp.]|jgi:hypothetical protein|nr:hypothetical protein [Candidatus Methanovirga basalitermitum]
MGFGKSFVCIIIAIIFLMIISGLGNHSSVGINDVEGNSTDLKVGSNVTQLPNGTMRPRININDHEYVVRVLPYIANHDMKGYTYVITFGTVVTVGSGGILIKDSDYIEKDPDSIDEYLMLYNEQIGKDYANILKEGDRIYAYIEMPGHEKNGVKVVGLDYFEYINI